MRGWNDNGEPALRVHDSSSLPARVRPKDRQMVEVFDFGKIVASLTLTKRQHKRQKRLHMGEGRGARWILSSSILPSSLLPTVAGRQRAFGMDDEKTDCFIKPRGFASLIDFIPKPPEGLLNYVQVPRTKPQQHKQIILRGIALRGERWKSRKNY